MGTKSGAVLEGPVTKTTCRHHWLIEPPNGPTSKGVCKLCGEEKLFDNIVADFLSTNDASTISGLANVVDDDDEEDSDGDGEELFKE